MSAAQRVAWHIAERHPSDNGKAELTAQYTYLVCRNLLTKAATRSARRSSPWFSVSSLPAVGANPGVEMTSAEDGETGGRAQAVATVYIRSCHDIS